MNSRVTYLLAWCIFLIIVFILVNLIKPRKALFNFCLSCVLVLFLFLGGSLINFNSYMNDKAAQIQEVIDNVGDAYLKAERGSVYIKIGEDWLNLDDVRVVSEFTQDIVLNYNGEDIYVGHSGVYNTIKVLQEMGFFNH